MREFPADDLPVLFNAAVKLGYALGITTEKAIESLTIGIGRQSRLVKLIKEKSQPRGTRRKRLRVALGKTSNLLLFCLAK